MEIRATGREERLEPPHAEHGGHGLVPDRSQAVPHSFEPGAVLRRHGPELPDGTAARDSKEHIFQALTEHTPVGIFVSDAQGRCQYVNERWCELAGMTCEQALGDGWSAALHPDDKERVLGEWSKASEAGESSTVEYRFLRPDGGTSWIQGFASAVHDEQGQVTGWVGTCLDLSDRKRVETALAQAEERFRRAFDDAPIGMGLVAPEGHWLRVNRSLCELVGFTESELLARTFQEITHPDDIESDLAQAKQLLAGEIRSYRMEKRYLRADGRLVPVMLSVSLVRDSEGVPLYFVSQIEDIGDRKREERELRRLAERDSLTGLLNHRFFREELNRELVRLDHDGQAALLLLDLDTFKRINDSFGHGVGDRVLIEVGRTLRKLVRQTDAIGRLGGDEFAVLLFDASRSRADLVAGEITAVLGSQPIVAAEPSVRIAVSVGVVMLDPAAHADGQAALDDADRAMYRAKTANRDRLTAA